MATVLKNKTTGYFELRSSDNDVLTETKRSRSSNVFQFARWKSSNAFGVFSTCLNDTFSFQIKLDSDVKRITEQSLLSQVMRTIDSIGLIGPVLVTVNIFLQSWCYLEMSWDRKLSNNLIYRWLTFTGELSKLISLEKAFLILSQCQFSSMDLQKHVSGRSKCASMVVRLAQMVVVCTHMISLEWHC